VSPKLEPTQNMKSHSNVQSPLQKFNIVKPSIIFHQKQVSNNSEFMILGTKK